MNDSDSPAPVVSPPEAGGARVALILPLYGKFAYARRAALSFFAHTPGDCGLLVFDDASPRFKDQDWEAWYSGDPSRGVAALPRDRVRFRHFPVNEGLTRSWNHGLAQARDLGYTHAVCGNSDVLFTPHWSEALVHQLDRGGRHLVGPVSNAPGLTNHGRQLVNNYYPSYRVDDSAESLHRTAEHVWQTHGVEGFVRAAVNGFLMMARTDVWWEGAFDPGHVFNPAKRMEGNEDELQRRWSRAGRQIGFCPGSFVFHYRSVSRGPRYRLNGWHRLRPGEENKPV